MELQTKEPSYLERNMMGFEGDAIFKSKMQQIITDYDIDLIIETGTYMGGTTRQLAAMVEKVITIESNVEFYRQAKENLQHIKNITIVMGKSDYVLSQIDEIGFDQINTLFFLDAHWEKSCPLLDELKGIAKANLKPVIIIHDFQVPDHPELGYDEYNGQPLNYPYIESGLKAIYGDDFTYEYNSEAQGAKRGVIFIYPANNLVN